MTRAFAFRRSAQYRFIRSDTALHAAADFAARPFSCCLVHGLTDSLSGPRQLEFWKCSLDCDDLSAEVFQHYLGANTREFAELVPDCRSHFWAMWLLGEPSSVR